MNTAPSIVLISTDTQGSEMIGAYGARPCVETPNIDRLAREGVRFRRAFTACPVCTPARATWYSGLMPSRNGAWTNNLSMLRGVRLLAEHLAAAGYICKHYGKWHLDLAGYNGDGTPDGGFEDWYDLTNFFDEIGRDGPNRFGGWNRGFEDADYCFGHRVADRAIAAMRSARDAPEPLFLAVEFDEPHGPYICPPPFRGTTRYEDLPRPATMNCDLAGKPKMQQQFARFLRNARRNPEDLPRYYPHYYDCNRYVDWEIGRVLDAVDEFLPRDTAVIFLSDHGDHLGAFGLCSKGPTMYDHTIQVPLIVRPPNHAVSSVASPAPGTCSPNPSTSSAREIDALVSSADLYPTVLDLAGLGTDGITLANGYAGRSVVPLLHGQSGDDRDAVFIEYGRFAIGNDQTDGFFPIRCIRTADWKLAINLFDRDELYCLAEDPGEERNRIDDSACSAIRDEMHDRLLAFQKQTSDPFRGPRWLWRPWRGDARHEFKGFHTTGWADVWDARPFD
jgi:uncharacterized sulfatase